MDVAVAIREPQVWGWMDPKTRAFTEVRDDRLWGWMDPVTETFTEVSTQDIIDNIFNPIDRITRDLRDASRLIDAHEARFLVDCYYSMQVLRISTAHQARTLAKEGEPNLTIVWLQAQFNSLERSVQKALDAYSNSRPEGQWARSITGVGPVIAAGMMSNIDINRAPTVGHIWRFAGLDPTMLWLKGEKRPFNASLKRLCCVPGTAITTRAGPKLIEQISVGDEVLTHRGRWRPVTQVMRNDYAGDVVTLRAQGMGQGGPTVTPNHPVLTKQMRVDRWADSSGRERFRSRPRVQRTGPKAQIDDAKWSEIEVRIAAGERGRRIAEAVGCSEVLVSMIRHGHARQPTEDAATWARADAIVPGWRMLSPTPPTGINQPRIQLTDLPNLHNPATHRDVEVTQDIARLVGLWLGDGHTSENRVIWSFGLHEGMLSSFVMTTLKTAFGIEAREVITDNMRMVRCGSQQLQRWLGENAGKLSHHKRIPAGWLDAGEEVLVGLLRGLFDADGYLGDRPHYTSVSWRLAQSVAQMLRALKIPAVATPLVNTGSFPGRSKVYACSFYRVTPSNPTAFYERVMGEMREPVPTTAVAVWDDVGAWHTARDPVTKPYSGMVYNLEVDEDHSYVADGIAVHNCWILGESFTKVAGLDNDVYGKVFLKRKEYETRKNDNGDYAQQCFESLKKNWKAGAEAPHWYRAEYPQGTVFMLQHAEASLRRKHDQQANRLLDDREAWRKFQAQARAEEQAARLRFLASARVEPGEGMPMLPMGRIHLRAQRYAVKLFLSHFHHVLHVLAFDRPPPQPYIMAMQPERHTHFVPPPNWPPKVPFRDFGRERTRIIEGKSAKKVARITPIIEGKAEEITEAAPKQRGKPNAIAPPVAALPVVEAPPKKRGRPKKVVAPPVVEAPAKRRGRPPGAKAKPPKAIAVVKPPHPPIVFRRATKAEVTQARTAAKAPAMKAKAKAPAKQARSPDKPIWPIPPKPTMSVKRALERSAGKAPAKKR